MALPLPAAVVTPAEGVCAFLSGLGVTPSSAIQLAGRGALPSLLWLCRHGFERVAIISGATSESADLLLCLDAGSLLAADLRRVRQGGLAILRTDRAGCAAALRRPLHDAGFLLERRLQSARRDVYIARRGGRDTVAVSAAAP
jgi:hypothetical protein